MHIRFKHDGIAAMNERLFWMAPLLLIMACAVGWSSRAEALPVPESGFGDRGLALVEFEGGGDLGASAFDVLVQPDGRILVAGHTSTHETSGFDAAIVRLLPDGTLDPSFGNSGRRRLNIVSDSGAAVVKSMKLDSEGRIVVLGDICTDSFTCQTGQSWFFARLGPDGSFDQSFDFNGVRIVNLGATEFAESLVVQADGRLLGVGHANRSDEGGLSICALVVRLNANGSNDESFGNDGSTCLFTDGSPPVAGGFDALALEDGRILVTGPATHAGTVPEVNLDMAVFRLLPHGALDTDFGTDGWRFIAFDQGGSFFDSANAIIRDRTGRIVLAGFAESGAADDMAVARLFGDGTLDESFGVGGKALIRFDNDGEHDGVDRALALSILDDGRILLAGTATRLVSPLDFKEAAAVAVLKADGSLDDRFGNHGRWIQALGNSRDTADFSSLAMNGDLIYLAGTALVHQPDSSGRRVMMISALNQADAIFRDKFKLRDPE
jgi:uncharacterized delta-60 repeat protein